MCNLMYKLLHKHIVMNDLHELLFGTACVHIWMSACVLNVEIHKIQLILLLILTCYKTCSLTMYVMYCDYQSLSDLCCDTYFCVFLMFLCLQQIKYVAV